MRKLRVANSKVASAAETVSVCEGDWVDTVAKWRVKPCPKGAGDSCGMADPVCTNLQFCFVLRKQIRMSEKYWQLIKSLKTFLFYIWYSQVICRPGLVCGCTVCWNILWVSFQFWHLIIPFIIALLYCRMASRGRKSSLVLFFLSNSVP